jgi:hypothetical protein
MVFKWYLNGIFKKAFYSVVPHDQSNSLNNIAKKQIFETQEFVFLRYGERIIF